MHKCSSERTRNSSFEETHKLIDIQHYLNVAPIPRDGPPVVKRFGPFVSIQELIIIPKNLPMVLSSNETCDLSVPLRY